MKVLLIKEYKIQLVCHFLYFLFYIASEFTSADFIFNIYWKKIFVMNFHFITDSPKPTTLLHHSLAETFCWCSLNLENVWFYIWVVGLWLNFTTQMTLHHLLLMPMNKILECKDHQIYSKMLRKICKKKV